MKVLLIYPGLFMQTALPLGLAYIAAALKSNNIDVNIFDTVCYQAPNEIDENDERAEFHHSTKKLDYASVGIVKKRTEMIEDFREALLEIKPDLIGLNAVESTFDRGVQLTREVKNYMDIPTIAGGIFPTLAPEIVLSEESIDMVCMGEGEELIVELCQALENGNDYTALQNLCFKREAKIIKNEVRKLKPLAEIGEPDFSCFDQHMFYKAMQGNLFKTIPLEISRGCPYHCTYCAEPSLKKLYKTYSISYFRKKSIQKLFDEIENLVTHYSPEFFYFATETFLAISDEELNRFIDLYKNIKIPFWIQTRPETITYDKILKLKEVGLFWLTIGIECGNEEYRRKHLKRKMSNDTIIDAAKILDELGQGASFNSILGLPFETRELIYETMELNRKIYKINRLIRANISIFTPFRGCELYDICIEKKMITPSSYISDTNISNTSMITLDSLSGDDLKGLYRTFPLYVYLPDEYLDRIAAAEQISETGNKEYEDLNRCVERLLAAGE